MRRPAAPQPKAFVAPFLVACLAVALGAAAFLAARELGGESPEAIADLGANPPQPPSVSAPWPDFSDTILHWQSYHYTLDPGSPEHSNGQEIRGEIWVHVGPDNRPVATRATFFHADGSFHQEYLYADGRGIVVYDEPVLDPDTGPQPDPCRQEEDLDAVTFDRLVDTGEPLFVDRVKLSSLGFEPLGGGSAEVPSLDPTDAGVAPANVVGNDGRAAEAWVKEAATENDSVWITVLELDAGGRLAVETHVERLAGGEEVVRQRFISTPVEVFAVHDSLLSLFDPSTIREGCGA